MHAAASLPLWATLWRMYHNHDALSALLHRFYFTPQRRKAPSPCRAVAAPTSSTAGPGPAPTAALPGPEAAERRRRCRRCRRGAVGTDPAGCGAAMAAMPRVLNVNVGVLGHIDSGKTALARALSTTGSTAAFDRAPQSRARGITLDLGFSCFRTALPPQLGPGPGELQFTLVDCPGHASLIRTIIGGKGQRGRPPLPGPLRRGSGLGSGRGWHRFGGLVTHPRGPSSTSPALRGRLAGKGSAPVVMAQAWPVCLRALGEKFCCVHRVFVVWKCNGSLVCPPG